MDLGKTEIAAPRHVPRVVLRRKFRQIGLFLLLACMIAPILTLILIANDGSWVDKMEFWNHMVATTMWPSIQTTLIFSFGISLITALLGTSTAWLITMYDFPARKILEWALLLPLAVPTYISAYCWIEFVGYGGLWSEILHWLIGQDAYRHLHGTLPELRSLGGAIFVISCVLYPYVYMTTRAVFLMQSIRQVEVARTLGASSVSVFYRVALPLARPAIVIGVSLALMEALNDFGAVEFFGVNTLSVEIYSAWLNKGSLSGAAQLSIVLLSFVVVLFYLETLSRRQQKYTVGSREYKSTRKEYLYGLRGLSACLWCSLPVVLGFFIPTSVLLETIFSYIDLYSHEHFIHAMMNTLFLALIAAFATSIIGFILAIMSKGAARNSLSLITAYVASSGYAIPGTVLAIGVMVALTKIDAFMNQTLGIQILLFGTPFALLYAYTFRFLAVGYGTNIAGYEKLSPFVIDASRSLGHGPVSTLGRVQFPLMRPAFITAFLLVFVESMKELPATLLLRPIGFDTLATVVYSKASNEAFEEAALPALSIVMMGLIPAIFIIKSTITKQTEPN